VDALALGAMKDGTNTDMLRGAVSKLWSGDFRMGKPTTRNGVVSISEFIGYEKADPGNCNI